MAANRDWLVLMALLSLMTIVKCDSIADVGKSEYQNILAKSELPNYGRCWKSSLQALTQGCKHLTNTMTHSLAYGFTRCFYMELGTTIPECYGSPEVCKGNLADKLHHTYVTFFMHTREMCYFLEGQAWQKATQDTVNKLSNISLYVVEQLSEADKVQKQIADSQSETLSKQKTIISASDSVIQKIGSLETGLTHIQEDFQETYNSQIAAVSHIFDKISTLEKIFVAEYTGVMALIAWTAGAVACCIFTSTQTTQGARFPMLMTTFIFALLEYALVSDTMFCSLLRSWRFIHEDGHSIFIYRCVKAWRWMCLIINFFVLLYKYTHYEDMNARTYQAVKEIMEYLQSQKSSATNSTYPTSAGSGDSVSHLDADSIAIAGKVLLQYSSPIKVTDLSSNGSVEAVEPDNTTGIQTQSAAAVHNTDEDGDSDDTEYDCNLSFNSSSSSLSSESLSLSTQPSEISISEIEYIKSTPVTLPLKKPVSLRESLLKKITLRSDSPEPRYNLRPRSRPSTPQPNQHSAVQLNRIIKSA